MNKYLIYLIATLLIIVHQTLAQTKPPEILWQHTYGGSLNDEARDIQLTTDGNLVFTGYAASSDGDVTGHHGLGDFWFVKTDLTGNLIWQKAYGGIAEDLGRCVRLTSDDGYILTGKERSSNGDVTGNHGYYDFWVVKLDASGNLQWQNSFGGSDFDNAYCVTEVQDGGYLVSGFTLSSDGQVTNQHGYEDYWVIKLDSNGNLLWQKTFGGSGYEQASNMLPAGNGDYVICGYSSSTDGDATDNNGSYDSWTLKIDESGNLLWQKMYGGSYEDGSRDLVATPDGGYIITGYTYSNDGDVTGNHGFADVWIYKIDSVGNLLWQKSYGGTNYEYSYAIEESIDGNYLVAGHTFSFDGDITENKGFGDAWIMKIDGMGNLIWQKTLGGSGHDVARDFIHTPDGQYLVGGFTQSVDGDVSSNHGGLDCWIVKLCEESAFYADADNDGFGTSASSVTACTPPLGFVSDSTDCNDGNASVHPNASDLCNSMDDNCDGQTDENMFTASVTPAGTITVCKGNVAVLSANAGIGLTYQWQKNAVDIAGATNKMHTTEKAGEYKVVESNSYGCSASSATIVVNLGAMRLSTITPLGNPDICETGAVVLEADGGSGLSYQWVKGNHFIAGATNQTYTATLAATYKVKVAAGNSCSKTSEGIKVINSCKESELKSKVIAEGLLIYPNPTDGTFIVELTIDESENEMATIEVMNAIGQMIHTEKTLIENGMLKKEITSNHPLSNGMYLVAVMTDHKIYSSQIVYHK